MNPKIGIGTLIVKTHENIYFEIVFSHRYLAKNIIFTYFKNVKIIGFASLMLSQNKSTPTPNNGY